MYYNASVELTKDLRFIRIRYLIILADKNKKRRRPLGDFPPEGRGETRRPKMREERIENWVYNFQFSPRLVSPSFFYVTRAGIKLITIIFRSGLLDWSYRKINQVEKESKKKVYPYHIIGT